MKPNGFPAAFRNRKLWWFLGLLVGAAVVVELRWQLNPDAPGSWLYTRREHQNRISFDSATWKSFPRGTNEWPHTDLLPVRIRMVDDLLKRHELRGQSRQQVERLLGPKTKTQYFSDWDLVYYLGPGRYGNAVGDSEWLVLRFNSAEQVEDCQVVHD